VTDTLSIRSHAVAALRSVVQWKHDIRITVVFALYTRASISNQ